MSFAPLSPTLLHPIRAALQSTLDADEPEDEPEDEGQTVLGAEHLAGQAEYDYQVGEDDDEYEEEKTEIIPARRTTRSDLQHEDEVEEPVFEGYSVTLRDILVRAGDSTFTQFEEEDEDMDVDNTIG